jgi:hypothetical protein
MEVKTCTACKLPFSLEQFNKDRKRKDGLQPRCKKCHSAAVVTSQRNQRESYRARQREWYEKNRERVTEYHRGRHLLQTYGMTPTQYGQILESQGGVCAICRQPETKCDGRTGLVHNYHVDHDHISGQVRGLLCNDCNTGLGSFGDDPELLIEAASYLERESEHPYFVSTDRPTGPATGLRNGKYTHPESVARGSAHPMAKLTQDQVDTIYVEGAKHTKQRDIGKMVGVGQSAVWRILAGKSGWKPSPLALQTIESIGLLS